MEKTNFRRHYEEVPKKVTVISTEKVKRICKSSAHRDLNRGPRSFVHIKSVLSDGYTKWECRTCGQVKFTKGITFKEEKVNES